MTVEGERTLLAEGREAEVFLQPTGTVLKLLRDPNARVRVQHEAAALQTLTQNGYPAPVPIEIVTVDGRPGLVMHRIEGNDLLTTLGRRPQAVLSAGRAMGRIHAQMHGHVAPAELPELHDLVHQRISDAPLEPKQRSRALTLLEQLPRGDRLCHGDFHIANMLGSWSEPVVIDWGDATRGDPTADVARSELIVRLGEPPPGAPWAIRHLARIGRGLLASVYIREYQRHQPLDRQLRARWRIVCAAARLFDGIPEERRRLFAILETELKAGA